MSATIDLINNAEDLAPVPSTREEATVAAWTRQFAALGLAAYAAAHKVLGKAPEEFGLLTLLGVTATAAAATLSSANATEAAEEIWELTPECGALNGEWSAWLVETLDRLGVNPADVDPDYSAADFRSPSVKAEVSA